MRPIKRVVCAMSGGVDSAVSAWLLKKRGFDVIGVYMINWDHVEEGASHCPRTKDQADAQTVCDQLGIELQTVNFVKEYWSNVFTPLIENYKIGRTIVSDVACNTLIKFDMFHKYAFEELGADAVATGHFARTSQGDFHELFDAKQCVKLLKPLDPLKDQTYFLSKLSGEQLRRSMFPVGSLLKSEVKRIAENELRLPQIAQKPESMGICFIGKRRNFESFLDQYVEQRPGKIVEKETGCTIGDHSGIHHFTIGKRVTVAPERHQSHNGLFVCELDSSTNTVYTCRGSHNPLLYASAFDIVDVQWINDDGLRENMTFRCQRGHPILQCAVQRISEERVRVIPRHPIRAVAPGQSCVFYENEVCLGSGEIDRVVNTL